MEGKYCSPRHEMVETASVLHLDLQDISTVHADYGFEYSDEEVQEEDVDIENQYYNSKGAGPESKKVQQVPVLELEHVLLSWPQRG